MMMPITVKVTANVRIRNRIKINTIIFAKKNCKIALKVINYFIVVPAVKITAVSPKGGGEIE
jgi:hypothetical protein